MVQRINQANNIQQWTDAEYCAMMFCLRLSGEIEMWLNQAEATGEAWVSDIKEIIVRLERRFETADGKEQAIRRLKKPSNNQMKPSPVSYFGCDRWQTLLL